LVLLKHLLSELFGVYEATLFYFYFLLLLYGRYIVTFAKVLITCHSWTHPLINPPLTPPTIPGIVSTGLIFFIYIHVHNISSIFILLHHFFISPPPHWYQPPLRTCFTFLFSVFILKCHFWLNMAIQVFHYFHVCRYYNPNWFISVFLLSILVPFLWWFQ
jgi:hypothetical protein